jgi:hypothetical protein
MAFGLQQGPGEEEATMPVTAYVHSVSRNDADTASVEIVLSRGIYQAAAAGATFILHVTVTFVPADASDPSATATVIEHVSAALLANVAPIDAKTVIGTIDVELGQPSAAFEAMVASISVTGKSGVVLSEGAIP